MEGKVMEKKLRLPKLTARSLPARQTTVKVSPEAYIALHELSYKTGMSLQEVASRLIIFASENVEITE